MNFQHNLAEIATKELNTLGISIPNKWNDYTICLKWLQVKQRRFNSDIPYWVLCSQELRAKLPHLSAQDRAAIQDIVHRLQSCEPITDYMGKEINTVSMKKSDFMLKNWNIYHLHLEKAKKGKPFTNPNLLFFQPKGQVVHLIDVKPHPKGAGWFDRDLLEIIYRNWPNLLTYTKDLTPSQTLPDSEVHELMKNLVTIIPFHEGALFPTGTGVMSSGDSSYCVRVMDRVFNRLARAQKEIARRENEIRKEIARLHKPVPQTLEFVLEAENNSFIAYEKQAQLKIKLFPLPQELQSQK